MSRKYFGTDGIRGRVGEFPITPDFVLKLGWAAGKALTAEGGRRRIVIGKDTRISGYMFESALEAGLVAAGVDVLLTGPMPTPAIAYLTRTFSADAGIVISASHNPYHDNGIKFFSSQGTKLPDDVEQAIEALIDEPLAVVESDELGKVQRINDAAGRYIEYCKGTVAPQLNLRGLKIVVDTANGATYHVGPDVLRELGAEVTVIGDQPDGLNINLGVGSTHLGQLSERVLAEQADLGIAFDGDGDRVLMVDHAGVEVDGDELLFIIATQMQSEGRLSGGVVGTLMTNLGMELALAERGIAFKRAKVGDRYVVEQLLANGWQLGGESSGHLICREVSTTGDGVIAALQVLRSLQATGKRLSELTACMSKCPMQMINVRMSKRQPIEGNVTINQAVESAEQQLGDQGRVLLRPSGTEPVIRVMVEGRNEPQVMMICQQLADVVSAELSAA